jgi:hypothetical protein
VDIKLINFQGRRSDFRIDCHGTILTLDDLERKNDDHLTTTLVEDCTVTDLYYVFIGLVK